MRPVRKPNSWMNLCGRLVRREPRAALLVGLAMGLAAAGGVPVKVHVVQPGESLWSIAALSDVYGDPFLWPLIYRSNRDQIPDPARIYPQQQLQIPPSAAVRPQASLPQSTSTRSQKPDHP